MTLHARGEGFEFSVLGTQQCRFRRFARVVFALHRVESTYLLLRVSNTFVSDLPGTMLPGCGP